jgi:tetratricopeptide (TPR) repeat protein
MQKKLRRSLLYADNSKEPTVITFTELSGIVIITIVLMILIFPKQSIEKAISQEKSNYDLTLIYLRSIAHAYPDDPNNWLRLIKAELQMGKTEEAQKVLEKLESIPSIKQIYLEILSYELLRTEYEKSTSAAKKKQLKAILQKRLQKFLQSDEPTLWMITIKEAQQLSFKETAYEAFAKRIAHTTLCTAKEIETFFYLGRSLHHEKETCRIIENYLKKSPDPKLYTLLKNHYLAQKAYAKAGKLSSVYYQKTKKPESLFEAVDYLFQAKEEKEALKLLKKYEENYLDTPAYARRIIELYLAHNRLKEAHNYTLKVMRHRKVLP